MKTLSAKDHLQALNEQLKAAMAAHNDEAKAHIQAALSQAEAARAELQAKLDRANDASKLHNTLGKLDEATATAKKALDAKGAQVKDHLKASIAAAQAALAK